MTDEAGSAPRVYVGPLPLPELRRAVEAGGCTLAAEASVADGVAWFGRDPVPLLELRHPGVRWLQLPDAGVERWLAAGVHEDAAS